MEFNSAETSSGLSSALVIPHIDESNVMDTNKSPKERIIELLDLLESHVEKIRKEACQLEENRDHLLSTLDSLRNTDVMDLLAEDELDDISRYVDRIVSRCLTVEVRVLTQRDKMQEEALFQVNHLIDALVMELRADQEIAKQRCLSFMSACTSSMMFESVADKNFESALLGCTLDDQKRVKKRLQGLLSYLDKLNVTALQ